MDKFNSSILGLTVLVMLAGATTSLPSLVGQGQGNNGPPFGQRQFYLTQTEHNGSEALSACAGGYHMASLWEIIDPSNLRYDAELGFTRADSGFGPPAALSGWIRTGDIANGHTPPAGNGNCQAWTSASALDSGAGVLLSSVWDSNAILTSPWVTIYSLCTFTRRVWCVAD